MSSRIGAATEQAQVPTFVLTLGTKSRLELDGRSCLGWLAVVSREGKYIGSCNDIRSGSGVRETRRPGNSHFNTSLGATL